MLVTSTTHVTLLRCSGVLEPEVLLTNIGRGLRRAVFLVKFCSCSVVLDGYPQNPHPANSDHHREEHIPRAQGNQNRRQCRQRLSHATGEHGGGH
jgi:hypothetical protein